LVFHKWSNKVDATKKTMNSDGRGVIVAGVSDMGPGRYQATAKLTGESTRGSCCAHAKANVVNAAAAFNDAYQKAVENSQALCKAIRSDRDTRAEAARVGLVMPSNPSKERWNRQI